MKRCYSVLENLCYIRRLYEIKEVLYDKEWLVSAENLELYYMYRGLYLSKCNCGLIKEHDLRYDITIIPSRMLGKECVKTVGHYHPLIVGTKLTYPEFYEVLGCEAHYLLHKISNNKIVDVALVKAEKMIKLLFRQTTGILLKMANWVERKLSSIYKSIKEKGGGAYFELVTGEFIKNTKYHKLLELRFSKAYELLSV